MKDAERSFYVKASLHVWWISAAVAIIIEFHCNPGRLLYYEVTILPSSVIPGQIITAEQRTNEPNIVFQFPKHPSAKTKAEEVLSQPIFPLPKLQCSFTAKGPVTSSAKSS